MKIAVFGKNFGSGCDVQIVRFFDILAGHGCKVYIYQPFYEYLKAEKKIDVRAEGLFLSHNDLQGDFSFFFSIGGDGTFLKSVSVVRDTGIPVIGLNTGRLGFLSNIAREEIEQALEEIFKGSYRIEERSLLQVTMEGGQFGEFPYALNEFTLHKSGSSMITIHAWVNDEFLNAYWADGLIISTPTGSTAYSMSVGGPVMTPGARDFIISPIAPHHLTVRPIVVSDACTLRLFAESRDQTIIASLDSQSYHIPEKTEILIRKAPFFLRTLQLSQTSFFSTLRNKLMWGADRRN
ncbi:MAG: NAD kinase [Bacteroidales bacterium]|nr:NAD kinase [Bacteroidales bacterium]